MAFCVTTTRECLCRVRRRTRRWIILSQMISYLLYCIYYLQCGKSHKCRTRKSEQTSPWLFLPEKRRPVPTSNGDFAVGGDVILVEGGGDEGQSLPYQFQRGRALRRGEDRGLPGGQDPAQTCQVCTYRVTQDVSYQILLNLIR